MNRLQSYYEELQFPIKLMFVASALIGIGSLLINPYITTFINIENTIIFTISQILLYTGGIILSYFPFYIFIKLLAHNRDERNIVTMGIVSYIIFVVVLALLTPPNLSMAVYENLGEIPLISQSNGVFNTGVLGLMAVYLMVQFVYRITSESKIFSLVSYVDKDSIRLLYSIIGAILLALGFAYLWPLFLDFIYKIMEFISTDVNNPMTMFAYGGFERLMTLFNLDTIIHQEFWFGPLGGTWVDLTGANFNGDVAIWTAQLSESVNVVGTSDAGRFTSAYYILNIFAVPAYLTGLYSIYSNKQYLKRNIVVLSSVVLISVLSGTLLPVELLMLITSPMIYIFHIFMTSLIFAVLSGLSIYLGFSYNGFLLSTNPGNLIDLLFLLRKQALFNKILILILIGIFIFIIYFLITRLYYSKLALDVLNIGSKQDKINDFKERLGGIDNITSINNTPTRLHVKLKDRDKLNVAGMHRQGVTRIIETRLGFVLSIGASAYIYQNEINKELSTLIEEEQVEDIDE